jgi:ATPase subunit of ABC transporter with duplicated ATPase domains
MSMQPETVEKKAPAANGDTVISIQHLSKSFGENHVLRDFSFDLKAGRKCGSARKIRFRKIGAN